MQVKTVTVEYSMTYNLGNYSNTKQAVSLTAEVGEDDSTSYVLEVLRDQASEHITRAITYAKLDYEQANKLDDGDAPF